MVEWCPNMERDEYARIAAAADQHWWYRSVRALLESELSPLLRPGGRFLDAGGGTGATGSWLAGRGTLVACDLEPAALELYRSARPDAGALAVADLAHLPFAPASFDAALCVTVLYHAAIASPAAVVGELARTVRPGGVVTVFEPGIRRLRRAHDRQTHAGRRFSLGDVRRLLVDNGLEVVRSTAAFTFLVPAAWALAALDRNGASSDLDRSADGARGLLPAVATVERRVIRRVPAPAGLSVLAVGRVR
jgi:SAM-dependent methyltransferase